MLAAAIGSTRPVAWLDVGALFARPDCGLRHLVPQVTNGLPDCQVRRRHHRDDDVAAGAAPGLKSKLPLLSANTYARRLGAGEIATEECKHVGCPQSSPS